MPVSDADLLRALLQAWRTLNHNLFRQGLRAPILEISDGTSRLGAWKKQSRTIALSRTLLETQPWVVVIEVLKHEIAHQYVDEVLSAEDETAHGPTFQSLCARLGIDPRSSGLPDISLNDEQIRATRRVKALLALANGTSEHEAQAATAAARRLMRKHNIIIQDQPRRYAFRQVGKISARRALHQKILGNILVDHFSVEGIWVGAFDVVSGRNGRVLEINGTPENLEIAAWVYDTLEHTAQRLWKDHKVKNQIKGNRNRLRFFAGVMLGFSETLREEAKREEERGLVWVKDADLIQTLHQRHPQRRSAAQSTLRCDSAVEDGRNAGKQIVLHPPLTIKKAQKQLLG